MPMVRGFGVWSNILIIQAGISYPILDLLVQCGRVVILKRQTAAHEQIEHNARTPNINLWSRVRTITDDLVNKM